MLDLLSLSYHVSLDIFLRFSKFDVRFFTLPITFLHGVVALIRAVFIKKHFLSLIDFFVLKLLLHDNDILLSVRRRFELSFGVLFVKIG